jgi:MarR family transcriptional regulator, organic hydroperoxide resistance regulator
MGRDKSLFHNCLYFTSSSLARVMTKTAEEAFGALGISPSHAFLLMSVNDHPGVRQKDLSDQLNLAPSTVTRFIDALVQKGFLERRTEGRATQVYSTPQGQALQPKLEAAWRELFLRYNRVLGEEFSRDLTRMVAEATRLLEA